ncbi:MAG TPA: C1 family peptidase [Bacteroidales bacterium]|nr:C1 family peptidase [Bacteroidales bacterium]
MKKRALNKKIKVRGVPHRVGTGWLAPLPDLRDFTVRHSEIKIFDKKLGLSAKKQAQKTHVDLREWCSPVEDQQKLGSCTAHAAAGIIEYFERRAYGKHIEASRLFLYKTARNLMQVTGDTGAWLRDTMGALVLCGVPDEKYWPYNEKDFDKEPGSFVYSVADNYQGVKYFCHDPQGSDLPSEQVLSSVKNYLEAGIPAMFGFWGFQSFEESDKPGDIPFPCEGESAQWGHAVMAVGYDDNRKIKNKKCNTETGGALLIRNSWGAAWGDNGYGWLPYDYVLNRLALDFWSLLEMEWVDSGEFGV